MNPRNNYRIGLFVFGLLLVVTVALTQQTDFRHKEVSPANIKTQFVDSTDNERPVDGDPWLVLEKIEEGYYASGGMQFIGQMRLLNGNSDNDQVMEEKNFDYSVLGNAFHYQLGSLEMVRAADMLIAVDHDAQSVMISSQHDNLKSQQPFDLQILKQLLEERKAHLRLSADDSLGILTVDHIDDPQIGGYRIYYDPVTYLIRRMNIGFLRASPLSPEEVSDSIQPDSTLAEVHSEQVDEAPTPYLYFLEMHFSQVRQLHSSVKNFHPEELLVRKAPNGKLLFSERIKNYELSINE